MLNIKLIAVFVIAFFIAGCSAGNAVIKKDQFNRVKTVAVITYTVPEKIEFREDPKAANSNSSALTMLVKAAISQFSGKGEDAANLASQTFIDTLNEQGLSFHVITPGELSNNPDFNALNTPAPVVQEEVKSGLMGSLNSFVTSQTSAPKGVGPKGLNQYGLISDWNKGSALMGTPEEKKYISDAIKALKVDAVLLVNDPGFSFVCQFCAGAAGQWNGDGSTGSAFAVSMVDANGDPILEMREWFATTDAHSVVVMSVVNPLQQEKLFKEHGKKMGVVFADFLKKKLAEK